MSDPKNSSDTHNEGRFVAPAGEHAHPAPGFVDENGLVFGFQNVGGKPRVSSTEYLYSISEGDVPGHVPRRILGRSEGVSTALSDLTELTTGIIPLPTTAQAVELVSTSGNDTSGGSGVRAVELHYLDADWNVVNVDVILTGLTPVTLATEGLRFNGIHATLVGGGGSAAGDIVVRDQGGAGVDYIVMKAGGNTSLQGSFSIPAGKTGFVTSWKGTAGKGKETELRLVANFDPHSFTKTDGSYNVQDFISLLSATFRCV